MTLVAAEGCHQFTHKAPASTLASRGHYFVMKMSACIRAKHILATGQAMAENLMPPH